ncbi:unnamed protein product [Porites lobata]|uniref:Exonuclease 1 n=1 Tax=Porites lobata TaxID=104759 RepID=A0ABN8REX5_9CNID|nr:unnamed protein product [Porites lobata]
MGIKTLLPFLKDVTENSYLDSFKGLVAAVDASCWLHKAIAISYSQFGDDRRSAILIWIYWKGIKIRPLVVFDGLPLPGKDRERDNRAMQRKQQQQKADQLRRSGKVTEARNALAAAAEINHDLVCGFIQTCRQKSIDYVVAPYEADAEIALLYEHGYVDIAISEDSDLLAYGCQKVLFKLRLDGVCEVIELGKVLQHLSLTQEEFLDMCIVAGCDYLENVRGIGIHTAHKLVTKEKTDFLAVLQRNRFAHLALTVSSLGQDNIEWTIPSFPVLTIEFVKGTVSITGRRTGWPALFQADDSGRTKCGDEIIAQKWCNIVVENITYLVIWEFRRSEPVEPEDHSIVNADDSDDSNEENDSSEIEHTVPFKVLGTAYKGRQIILKNAYECLENNKRCTSAAPTRA